MLLKYLGVLDEKGGGHETVFNDENGFTTVKIRIYLT
jgi:hypothetical protein